MKIDCEECLKEIELNKCKIGHEIMKKYLPDKVERHYLQCPNCEAKYTSHYLNEELKQIQTEIRIIRQKAQKSPLKIKQKNRITKLERQLKHRHDQLKEEIEAPVEIPLRNPVGIAGDSDGK